LTKRAARDSRAIDRHRDRLAHARVVKRRTAAVERHRPKTGERRVDETDVRRIAEADALRGRQQRPLEIARAQHREVGIDVGHVADDDLGRSRRAAEVVRVRPIRDLIAALPIRHLVRPRADRVLVERRAAQRPPLEQVRRHDRHSVDAVGEERRNGRRPRALEADDRRVLVRRCDRSDEVVSAGRRDVVARIDDRAPREPHVV